MSKFSKFLIAAAVALCLPMAVGAQTIEVPLNPISSFNGSTTDATCVLVKYVGSTVGKPTVETAAGGDVTFKIAGAADTTTGSPSLNGVFDLSTPAVAVDTMGEFVNLVNTTGSNWKAVLVGCLAADFTDNALDTLAATDASTPKGVAMNRDAAVASATTTFSAQAFVGPPGADTDMRFFLSGNKINPNPFGGFQPFVQLIREKITSTGTVGLFAVLGVTRTYDSSGKVSETVRTIYSETGAATTVEKTFDATKGPLVGAPGETIILRQRTGTDLTAVSLQASGFNVKVPK